MPRATTVQPTVVWIDDDAPIGSRVIEGCRVLTAQSCEQADRLIRSLPAPPRWVVLDVFLPQDGWGQGYLEHPGIEFYKDLRNRFGSATELAVYTICVDARRRRVLAAAGVDHQFLKSEISFPALLRHLTGNADASVAATSTTQTVAHVQDA